MKKLIIFALAALLLLSACATARQKLSPQGNVDYKTANVYYQQKNVEQAETYYAKVLADNPDHAIALRRMADINLHKGEQFRDRSVEFNQKAYEYYTRAIQVTESFSNLTDEEKIDLRDMKKRKDGSWTRIYLAAEQEMTNGNTAAAMTIFELASQLDPSRPEPKIQLKNIYLKDKKDDAKAEQILLGLLKDDPDKLGYLQELGAYYYNKENYAEAVKYYEKVKLQLPVDIDNLMNISACYYEMKDFPKAMAATQAAMDIDPNNADLVDNAVSIAQKMDDKLLAIQYLKLLVDKRDDENDYSLLCNLLLDQKEYTELIKYAEKWYNWDKTNKFAVEYAIFGAQMTQNKALESKYQAIKKTMP
jgi:tetratricopeptide (TPR) repeat protein